MRTARPFTRRPALLRGFVSACLALLLVQVAAGAAPAARRTRLQPLASSPSGAFVQDETADKRGGERDGAKENASARMAELDATLERLRQLGAHDSTDNALRAQWEAAVLEYASLTNASGGDRAPLRSAGDEDAGARAPESAPPAPPNCTATSFSFSNTTAAAIPDLSVITSTIVVSGAGPYLYDADVQTFITHTFPGDLDFTIMSPAGTVVTLSTDNAGTNDNVFNGTVWDDDADPNGVAPFTATAESVGTNANSAPDHPYANNVVATPLAPEEPLGAFLGEDPNGTWTLTVRDDAPGITGTLNSWSLMLSTLPSAPTTTTATGSNTTPVAIATTGNPTISSTITIATPGTSILDVNVTTAITHTFSQDLQITLTHGATTVTLASNPINEVAAIGDLDNIYNGTTWDDDANPGGQVPYTSNAGLATDHPYVNNVVVPLLAPSEALSAFIGEDPNGVWTLTIGDRFTGDGGALNSWSLNITTATCAPPAAADLGTMKTASPMVVSPGQNVTYTVTTTNNGTSTPGTITITDALPANATFVSATPSAGGSVVQTVPVGSTGGTLIYSYPGVATGASVTLTVVVAVPAGTPDGTLITNTATGTSDIPDPTPGNNSAMASATVGRSADISVTKTDSPDPVGTGGQITYTVTATNNGPDTPDSITITDALPPGVTFVSATGGTAAVPDPVPGSTGGVVMHSFTSGIGPGQSVVLTIVVGVPVATADGTVITNMASAASNVADSTPANNMAAATTTVTAAVDLSVTKTDSPDPVMTGATLTYTLAVANAGPGTATNVVVSDTLPASLTFVGATSAGATQGGSGNARTFTYPTLAPGASATITIQATVSCAVANGSTITNTATVTSPETDTSAANNTATATTTATNPAPTVTCPANVTAGATTTQGSTQGAIVTYTTPTATDNCPGATVACVPASGSFFPVGTTTVTCTATDSGGGTGTCSFSVTVSTAFGNCFVDDATGDTLSIVTDPASPLYRTWQYRVAATGQVISGSAESLSFYPGRSLVAYDHDTTTVRMDLNVNYGARTATATVRTLGAGGRTFTLRDRNTANNPPCQ